MYLETLSRTNWSFFILTKLKKKKAGRHLLYQKILKSVKGNEFAEVEDSTGFEETARFLYDFEQIT